MSPLVPLIATLALGATLPAPGQPVPLGPVNTGEPTCVANPDLIPETLADLAEVPGLDPLDRHWAIQLVDGLACLALAVDEPAWRLTFFELMLAAIPEQWPIDRATSANVVLSHRIVLGLAQDIVDLADELPESALNRIHASRQWRDPQKADMPYRVLPVDLSAARFVAGVKSWTPPPQDDPASSGDAVEDASRSAASLQRELLARLAQAGPAAGDFDCWLRDAACAHSAAARARFRSCLWAGLVVESALSVGDHELAQVSGAPCRDRLEQIEQRWQGAEQLLPPHFRGLLYDRVARIRSANAALVHAVGAAPSETSKSNP